MLLKYLFFKILYKVFRIINFVNIFKFKSIFIIGDRLVYLYY